MAKKITLYSKTPCGACIATKRAFTNAGIEFEVQDLTNDFEAQEELRAEGFTAFPVVKIEGGESWCGLQPARIEELTAAHAVAA